MRNKSGFLPPSSTLPVAVGLQAAFEDQASVVAAEVKV